MNPQYMNPASGPFGQGPFPPQGYGSPAPGAGPMMGQRPPVSGQNFYNGPAGGQRPAGPPGPGNYPVPANKPGMPPSSMHNGPAMAGHPGPQGEPFRGPAPPPGPHTGPRPPHPGMQGQFQGTPRGHPGQQQPPPGQFPGAPQGQQFMRGPPPPGTQPPFRGPSPNTTQMSSQMGALNISGPPPRGPGAPPTSMGPVPAPSMQNQFPASSAPGGQPFPPQPGQPVMSNTMQRPQGPPQGFPPSTMAGMPPGGMMPARPPGPPTSMQGPPPTSMQGPHPTSMQGPPPPSMPGPPSGPPTSLGGQPHMPPTSMNGLPPSSMAGPPVAPGQYGPPGQVPASMAGPPPMGQYRGQTAGRPQVPGPPVAPGASPPLSPGAQFGNYSGQQQPAGFSGQRGMPGQPGPMPQPQQPRRLDPDQMPSPIQVIEDDKRSRSGIFQTGQRGSVPPLVTTPFLAEDQGNCNPRFMRASMYNVPCTADQLKQSHIPMAVAVTPMAKLQEKEQQPPVVNLGQMGPVRCNRCKAYMCPFMKFIDGGRRFQCAFCPCITEVPPEYFAHLDHTGRRVDTYDRPELCLGSYEFVATTDYCKNNVLPKPPAFIFMIDVSYNAVKSGLVHLICSRLKDEVLVNLPKETGAEESEIRVGFVTYAKELHFYNVKGNLAQPQMLVVSDVQDVFVPLLDGFLIKLSESEAVIDSLMAQIPQMFGESRETEIVLGPVIQAGLDALKSADCSGKLFIFHTSLPIAEAPGKLKNRDDRKLLGTEKEKTNMLGSVATASGVDGLLDTAKTVLTPQANFYTKLGQECVAAGCGVDLFLFPNSYIDVATIAEVPRLTGGSIYKYTYFQADLDGNRFLEDLKTHVQKPVAFDAIMRIRTSTGIRPTDFLGNFYMSNTTDVELANVDCDKSVSVEIKHDDKLSEEEGAFIQAAILYTNMSGQRRLRCHNLALNVCAQMADMFRNCELDTLINFMAKSAMRQTLSTNPKQVRESVTNQVAHILACYRKNCASPSSPGQLILPECMKLLPVYANCVLKSQALLGGSEVSTDDRSYLMFLVNAMTVKATNVFFYPRLLPLHDADPESVALPQAVRCSVERLRDNGVYLAENGLCIFLWIGLNVNPEWVQNVFGVQSAAMIDIDKTQLLDLDNTDSQKLRNIIKKIRDQRQRHLKLTVVRQRDKLEPLFNQLLVEDKGASGTASYVDFLCHIHKEIRNLNSI